MTQVGSHGEVGGAISLKGVTKLYGDRHAIRDISLHVAPGEFLTLLGPSGSGKTTTLRIIAGFIQPDAGMVELDGRNLVGTPPHKRSIGVVFQNYALFPHMTAWQNIEFPLQMRRMGRDERRVRVQSALDLVQLSDFRGQHPRQLSGGQQQRIALARAIVFEPSLLLMDEPLGALDKKLREAMQLEIMRISRQLGITVIYVTHDQEEALAMSDRIAIYRHGEIEQVGTGQELYERPASLFVADFIGESNIFRGRFQREPGGSVVVTGRLAMRVPPGAEDRAGLRPGDPAALVVRPESLRVIRNGSDPKVETAIGEEPHQNVTRAVVREVIYLGPLRKYVLELPDGTTARADIPSEGRGENIPAGTPVKISWRVEAGILVAQHDGPSQPDDMPHSTKEVGA